MPPFLCLILLGGLLPPSQGLLNLLNPKQAIGGLLGTGGKSGLLGTGVLGEGGLLGTGLLGKGSPSGGPLEAANEPSRSGVLGTGLLGGQPGSSGLLGTGILGGEGLGNNILGGEGLGNGILSGEGLGNSILGGEGLGKGILGGEGLGKGILGGEGLGNSILGGEGLGKGILGGEGLGNGLLNNGLLGNGLLGNNSLLGDKGLLGTGLLGKGGLLGNGSLLGLDGLLGEAGGLLGAGDLLGGGTSQKMSFFAWLKVLNLENARVSWKVLHGKELVLNLYSKLVLRFPGIFNFLSGSSVETNITSHIALTQDTPGNLKLAIKDCNNLLGGFSVNLRKGLLTNLVSRLLNSTLKSLVPALFCPLVNGWVRIINIKLQFLRIISFGLLGKIYSALSKLPVTSEHSVELDLQDSPFPSTFIDWLLQTAGVNPGSNP